MLFEKSVAIATDILNIKVVLTTDILAVSVV